MERMASQNATTSRVGRSGVRAVFLDPGRPALSIEMGFSMNTATLTKLIDLRHDFRETNGKLAGFRSAILEATDIHIPINYSLEMMMGATEGEDWFYRDLTYASQMLSPLQIEPPPPPGLMDLNLFKKEGVIGDGSRPN